MKGMHSAGVPAALLVLWACAAGAQVVTPRVLDADLRKLPASPVWTPGSPGREMPDLKRSDVQDPGSATYGRHILRLSDRGIVVYSLDGVRLAGPLAFGSLWSAAPEPCGVDVETAPLIQVDRAAGRWVISRVFQPTADGKVPFCVAISRTADPVTGGWQLYDFALPVSRSDGRFDVSNERYRLAAESGAKQIHITFDRNAMLAGKSSGFTVSTQ
jgi:hypothetical protein